MQTFSFSSRSLHAWIERRFALGFLSGKSIVCSGIFLHNALKNYVRKWGGLIITSEKIGWKWMLIFLFDYDIEMSFGSWRSCSVSGRVRSARRHGWAPLFLALPGSGSPRQSTERQPRKLSGDTADIFYYNQKEKSEFTSVFLFIL